MRLDRMSLGLKLGSDRPILLQYAVLLGGVDWFGLDFRWMNRRAAEREADLTDLKEKDEGVTVTCAAQRPSKGMETRDVMCRRSADMCTI
jgi:hypothetical protein